MTPANDSNDTSTAKTSDSVSPRRQFGSNIGLRRQQASATNPAVRQERGSGISALLDTYSRQSLHSARASRGGHTARPPSQTLRSRLQTRRLEKSSRLVDQEDDLRVDSTSDDTEHANSDSSVTLGTPVTSDGGLSPAILINPDHDLLPVAKTAEARASFDFYINSYVKSIIEVSPQSGGNYSSLVHQILHDELLFVACTTCSEAARWRSQNLYDDPPIGVAKGYGRTISLLSQRLRSERFAMSSTVLLTMGQLTAIETLIKNVSATARHLAGMQSVMKAKSGAKPSEGSSNVQTAVDIWTQYFMYRATVKSQINRGTSLVYPRHPFDPKLSVQLSELPIGFADIALSGRCSIQLLDLMTKFDTYFTTINNMIKQGIADSPEKTSVILLQAAYCIEYFQLQTLTLIERLILVSLTAHVVRRDRIHPALVNMRNYFQITCAFLVNLLGSPGTKLHTNDQDSDLVTWIGLVLLLTSTPEAHARKLALKLLPARPAPMKILKKCQDFFWDEDLTNALLSGNILVTAASNDIIADNVKQSMLEDSAQNAYE